MDYSVSQAFMFTGTVKQKQTTLPCKQVNIPFSLSTPSASSYKEVAIF